MTDYSKAIIHSGEGETGIYERHVGEPTLAAVNQRASRERCGEDRWASVWVPAGLDYAADTYIRIDRDGRPTGDMRTITDADIN